LRWLRIDGQPPPDCRYRLHVRAAPTVAAPRGMDFRRILAMVHAMHHN
jgi:hypothetical protein